MNRLVRTLVGVVVAKAAVVAGWYLYQKASEIENDWKTEGKPEVKEEVKPETVVETLVVPVEKAEKAKRIRKPVAKVTTSKEVTTAPIAPIAPKEKVKRVRKPAVKKESPVVEEVKTPVKKTTRSRVKKTV